MKKEIKILVYEKEVRTLATKKAEDYDEFTYCVGPCKGNIIRRYFLYDKNTGFEVCYGNNKKDLLEKYESIKERYANIKEKTYYKDLINQYKEMLEKGIGVEE